MKTVICPKCKRKGQLILYPPAHGVTSASIIHKETMMPAERGFPAMKKVTDYCFITNFTSMERAHTSGGGRR